MMKVKQIHILRLQGGIDAISGSWDWLKLYNTINGFRIWAMYKCILYRYEELQEGRFEIRQSLETTDPNLKKFRLFQAPCESNCLAPDTKDLHPCVRKELTHSRMRHLGFLGLASLCTLVASHSFLIHPDPDWKDVRQPECRVGKPEGPEFDYLEYMQCPGPCGQEGNRFGESRGHTTLARGQRLYMKWTKNNHNSGFVRFTLVPKALRMNKAAHDMFAFRYSCWEAGEIGCEAGTNCGTDETKRRFQTEVEIPRVFPNGDYILGWTWYGGTQYRSINGKQGPMSEMGDYWSCANVRIRGSVSSQGRWSDDTETSHEYTPIFRPGMNDRTKKMCFSAVDRLGICDREPCKVKDGKGDDTNERYMGEWRYPAGFSSNTQPAAIRSSDIQATISNGVLSVMPTQKPSTNRQLTTNLQTTTSRQTTTTASSTINESPNYKYTKKESASGDSSMRFEMVNTRTAQIIPFDFSGPINVSSFVNEFSVRVVHVNSREVESVSFYINDQPVSKEEVAPYYIAGDEPGVVFPWKAPDSSGKDVNMPLNTEFRLKATATMKTQNSACIEAVITFTTA